MRRRGRGGWRRCCSPRSVAGRGSGCRSPGRCRWCRCGVIAVGVARGRWWLREGRVVGGRRLAGRPGRSRLAVPELSAAAAGRLGIVVVGCSPNRFYRHAVVTRRCCRSRFMLGGGGVVQQAVQTLVRWTSAGSSWSASPRRRAGAADRIGTARGPGLRAANHAAHTLAAHQPVHGRPADVGETVAAQPPGHLPASPQERFKVSGHFPGCGRVRGRCSA